MLFSLSPFLAAIILVSLFVLKRINWQAFILALALSSWAAIFFAIRQLGSWFGGADIGYGLILLFSPVLCIPMAAIGIYWAKKLNDKKIYSYSFLAVVLWLGLSFAYNHSIHLAEIAYHKKSEIDPISMPMHFAIKEKRYSDLAQIKNSGANIEQTDHWGRTALVYAIYDYEALKILLDLGANPNAIDHNGMSALSLVLIQNTQVNFAIADLLISKGANVNLLYKEYNSNKAITILNSAVIKGRVEIVDYLLQKSADPSIKDEYMYNACDRLKQSSTVFDNLKNICAKNVKK